MLSMKSGQRSIQQGMVCVRKERRRGWGEEGCRDAVAGATVCWGQQQKGHRDQYRSLVILPEMTGHPWGLQVG